MKGWCHVHVYLHLISVLIFTLAFYKTWSADVFCRMSAALSCLSLVLMVKINIFTLIYLLLFLQIKLNCISLNPSDRIRLMRWWDCCVTVAKLTRQQATSTLILSPSCLKIKSYFRGHFRANLESLRYILATRSGFTSPNTAKAIIS